LYELHTHLAVRALHRKYVNYVLKGGNDKDPMSFNFDKNLQKRKLLTRRSVLIGFTIQQSNLSVNL